MHLRLIILTASFLAFFLARPAPAKVIYVAPHATGDGSGSSWGNACPNIRAGWVASASGDEIWVKSATYSWLHMSSRKSGVAIYGGFAGSEETRNERDWARNKTIITGGEVPVYCYRVSNIVLDGFTVTGGIGSDDVPGGGICIDYSSLTIANCVIADNHVSVDLYDIPISGAGAHCGHSSVTFLNCAIYDNSARWGIGGGLMIWDSSVRLIFCTIAGNSAYYGGGGIFSNDSQIVLDHCIVSGNESTYDEDGIMIYGIPSKETVVYSCVQGGWSGTGNISANPWFVDSANQDYSLRSGSRCIDAGTNDTAQGVPFDLGRRPRVIDGDGDGVSTVDMGAYEFNPAGPPPTPTSTNTPLPPTATPTPIPPQLWILDAHGQVHHLPAPTPTP